jgi:hypothetical protein
MGVLLFLLLAAICIASTRQREYLLAGSAWLVATLLALMTLREISAAMATFRRAAMKVQEL